MTTHGTARDLGPSRRLRRTRRTWLVGLLALAAALVGLGTVQPAEARRPVASARPTTWAWGVNGPVYAVEAVGNRLFVGGDFTMAVSTTGATLPRENLAAFSLPSGRPIAGWRADSSAPVFALAASSQSLWVGGAFETVGGDPRSHLAKVSVATGAVDPAFVLDTSGAVRAISQNGNRLVAGGDFAYAGEKPHAHIVAANALTGVIDEAFQTSTDGTVRSLDQAKGRLYVGGHFQLLDGEPRVGLGAVDVMTGAVVGPTFALPGGANTTVTNVLAIDVSTDGRRVVGGVDGNRVLSWSPTNGRLRWQVPLGGDGQAVELYRGTVYAGFHHAFGGNKALRLIAVNAKTGKVVRGFKPTFTGYWGVHAIDASKKGIAVGGEFTRVDSRTRLRTALFPFTKNKRTHHHR